MEEARRIRLAVVDDDPIFLDQVSEVLAHEGAMRVVKAANGEELMEALEAAPVDCVLIDYDLGDETGLGVGEQLQERFSHAPPIVMMTGVGGERTAVKAFRSGFSDYVSKRHMNTAELLGAIRGAVSRRRVEEEAQGEVERLKRQLEIDPVTGLYAAAHMRPLIAEFVARGPSHPFGLILVRPADLAQIDENFGRAVADRVAGTFAVHLRRAAPHTSIFGHYDAESFVCLIDHDATPAHTGEIAARLAAALAFEMEEGDASLRIVPGVGAALYPENGDNAEMLATAASTALERSRDAGTPFGLAFDLPVEEAGKPKEQTVAPPAETVVKPAERAEQRRAHRQRVLKRGKIIVRELQSVLDCTIRDLSPSGGRLRVDGFFVAPDHFELQIVGAGPPRPVRTRWQIANDIGVEFEEDAQ